MKKYISSTIEPINWFRIDEIEDVKFSLLIVNDNYDLIMKESSNYFYWKSIIIFLHNALQGSIVCFINDSSGVTVLKKDSRNRMMEYLKNFKSTEYPSKIEMVEFMLLYKLFKRKTDSKDSLDYSKITPHIKKLNKYRNNFVHFLPEGRSIDPRVYKEIVNSAILIIEIIIEQPSRIIIYGQDILNNIAELCTMIKEINTVFFNNIERTKSEK